MENVYYMRTLVALLILSLLGTHAYSGDMAAEVALRYSKRATMIRLVLESDDETIGRAITYASPGGIQVNFPSDFQIKRPPDFPFETAKNGRALFIKLRDVASIRTSRLSAPARIVFDIVTAPATPKEPLPPSGPVVSPVPQRPSAPQPPPTQPVQKAPQQQPLQPAQKAPLPPPTEEKLHLIKTVVVDPGHGGYEYGIVAGNAREKDTDLALSKDLGAALAKKGKSVFLTRRTDQSISLDERIAFANAKSPDLFVSIHAGLSPGFVIYLASPEDQNADAVVKLYARTYRQSRYIGRSRAAASAIGLEIKNDLQAEVVLRELPLPVLNSLNAPALLIEYPSLSTYASDKKMREKLVTSIMKGIATYEQQ
ncbi:MAG: N-acetylmuramoyl-L-alanine amidase family protein [Acidobacteriota bacterium]